MGVPTYETLNLLHNKIKANAMVVHFNLGGRKQGYLRLVASPNAHALLTNTPFFLKIPSRKHAGTKTEQSHPNRLPNT